MQCPFGLFGLDERQDGIVERAIEILAKPVCHLITFNNCLLGATGRARRKGISEIQDGF
jgi:hypothetical protein